MNHLLEHEVFYRLGFSSLGLVLFLGLGLWLPLKRSGLLLSPRRWLHNVMLSVTSMVLFKLLALAGMLSLSYYAQHNSVGVMNQLSLPMWVEGLLSFLLLDLIIYWQHRLTHQVPILWRLHRVHHTDTELDATTANRFHPVEIFLSFLLKLLAVYLFGLSPVVIITFEILLNFSALFNHGNYALPKNLEKWLRYGIVTPEMHRIHHSVYQQETDSNYGFCLSCWDRVFGSYTPVSKDKPSVMKIGLHEFRSPSEQTLLALLKQPFINVQGDKNE